MNPNRPSVSRDTRLLLGIVLVSIAMLWILARIRFPDRVPTPNPVPPVLAQLTAPSAMEDIATSIAQLEPRLEPLIAAVDVERQPRAHAGGARRETVSALRFRDDLAVAIVGIAADAFETRVVGGSEIGRDPASQLSVVRLSGVGAPMLSTWTPRRLPYPRFMITAAATHNGISFRPIFVDSLRSIWSPTWMASIWMLPPQADLAAGTVVFTIDGALAGLAVNRGGQPALVPADAVLSLADRLARGGTSRPGRLGIEVQPLTPALAAATGASTGVVVSWVDPAGPAADAVSVGDVIDRIGDEAMTTIEHWQARTARLTAGESIVLEVRHQNAVRTAGVTVRPVVAAPAAGDSSPGLTLRTAPRVGATIVRVEPDSPAGRAGLVVGDVLTLVGDIQTPTAAQATRALASASRDRPMVIGVLRAGTHRVLTLERTW
jgi:S1-C subfamily serine protease